MSNNGYRRFEKFINGFTDEEFDDWINGDDTTWKNTNVDGASDRQAEFAKTLRTPLSEQEEEDIEREQESRITEVYDTRRGVETPTTPIRKTVIVTDNRDLPPARITRDIIIPPTGKAPIIAPPRIETPRELQRVSTTIKQPALRQRVTSAIRGFFARFRRKQ